MNPAKNTVNPTENRVNPAENTVNPTENGDESAGFCGVFLPSGSYLRVRQLEPYVVTTSQKHYLNIYNKLTNSLTN